MLLTPICTTLTDIFDNLIIELERPGVTKKALVAACSTEALRLGEAAEKLTDINNDLIKLQKALQKF